MHRLKTLEGTFQTWYLSTIFFRFFRFLNTVTFCWPQVLLYQSMTPPKFNYWTWYLLSTNLDPVSCGPVERPWFPEIEFRLCTRGSKTPRLLAAAAAAAAADSLCSSSSENSTNKEHSRKYRPGLASCEVAWFSEHFDRPRHRLKSLVYHATFHKDAADSICSSSYGNTTNKENSGKYGTGLASCKVAWFSEHFDRHRLKCYEYHANFSSNGNTTNKEHIRKYGLGLASCNSGKEIHIP